LLPAIDLGIFVITLLLSTVTVEVTPVGKEARVDEEGIVKFFGSQSSIKKPIVDASVGSTCGAIVVVSIGFGGGGSGEFFFSQEEKDTTIKKAFVIKEIQAFEIISDLFIILRCGSFKKLFLKNLLQAEELIRNTFLNFSIEFTDILKKTGSFVEYEPVERFLLMRKTFSRLQFSRFEIHFELFLFKKYQDHLHRS
jgi:hypothetical protein